MPGPLWHAWETTAGSGVFSAAQNMGGWLTSGISVGRNDDDRLEVFGRAAGGDLSHKWQLEPRYGTHWSGWASLGGALRSGPYTWQGFRFGWEVIVVDVIGVDGIWHRKQQRAPNCCWTPDWQ